jgi:hypothetical protein
VAPHPDLLPGGEKGRTKNAARGRRFDDSLSDQAKFYLA